MAVGDKFDGSSTIVPYENYTVDIQMQGLVEEARRGSMQTRSDDFIFVVSISRYMVSIIFC